MTGNDFPATANGIRALIKSMDYDFSMSIHPGWREDAIVVGLFNNNSDSTFALTCFFSSLNRTKNAVIREIDEYLAISGENILPEGSLSEALFGTPNEGLSYHLENLVIRIGSMWDQLAHICNLFYELGKTPRRVDYGLFRETDLKKDPHPAFKRIIDYYGDDGSFAGENCQELFGTLRNTLVHYCDFTGTRFFFDYMELKSDIWFYPTGYFFSLTVFHMLKCVEFAKTIYDGFVATLGSGSDAME